MQFILFINKQQQQKSLQIKGEIHLWIDPVTGNTGKLQPPSAPRIPRKPSLVLQKHSTSHKRALAARWLWAWPRPAPPLPPRGTNLVAATLCSAPSPWGTRVFNVLDSVPFPSLRARGEWWAKRICWKAYNLVKKLVRQRYSLWELHVDATWSYDEPWQRQDGAAAREDIKSSQVLPRVHQVQTSTSEDGDIQKLSPSPPHLKQNKSLFSTTWLDMPEGKNNPKLFAGQRPQDNKE